MMTNQEATTTPTKETDAATFRPTTRYEECVAADFARKLERERDEARAMQLNAIKHLNRIATWVQQDPTGPWNKLEIQKWVLNEIRAALGQEPLPQLWQPESVNLEAELTQLRKVCDELAECLINSEGIGDGSTLINRENKARENYSTLPHVIKAKGNKQ